MAAVIFLRNFSITKVTNGSSNTSVTGTIPAGTQVGDLLVAMIGSSDQLLAGVNSVSATDWLKKTDNYSANGGTACHSGVLYRQYSGTENLVFNIGADTRDDQLVIASFYGAYDSVTPIGNVSTYVNSSATSFTAGTLNTTVNDSLLVSFCVAKNGASGASDDTGQPSGMTIIHNRRSQALSTAIRTAAAYENISTAGATGTRVWSSFLTSAQYGTAINFVINAASGTSLTSVNSGAGVITGSTGNIAASTGTWSGSVTTGSLGGKSVTVTGFNAGTGNITFTMPGYVDGDTYPKPNGTHSVTFSDGTYSPVLAGIPLAPPAGRSAVDVSSPDNADQRKLGYWLALDGKTPVNGDVIVGVDSQVTWLADTGGSTAGPLPLTTEVVFWQASSGRTYVYNVTINAAGEIVSVNGLTSIGLTSIGLTSTGLTSVGL